MSEERVKILQMLQDGVISVEDANRLLEALGDEKKKETGEASGEGKEATQYNSSHNVTQIKNIEISWLSGGIEIYVRDIDMVNVSEYAKKDLTPDERLFIDQVGDTLYIRWTNKKLSFPHNILSMLMSKRLVVEIPRSILENLGNIHCKNISGMISARDLKGSEVRLNSTSGKIEGYNITAGSFTAENISGRITLQGVGVTYADIKSVSGGIDISGVNALEVYMRSTSGGMKISDLTCTRLKTSGISGKILGERIEAETVITDSTSGKIEMAGKIKSDAQMNTVSGSVKLELENCPANMRISTMSGAAKVSIPDNGGFTANYSSGSGKFSSDFPCTMTGNSTGTAVYGNGGAMFSFKTTSGNMKISNACF